MEQYTALKAAAICSQPGENGIKTIKKHSNLFLEINPYINLYQ